MEAIQSSAALDGSRSLSSAGSTVELLPITSQFFRPFAPLPAAGGHVIVTCGNKEARIAAAPTDAFADVVKATSAALGVDVSGMFACTAGGTTLAMPENLGTSLAYAKILNGASRRAASGLALASVCAMIMTPDPAPRPRIPSLQMASLDSVRQPSCSCT